MRCRQNGRHNPLTTPSPSAPPLHVRRSWRNVGWGVGGGQTEACRRPASPTLCICHARAMARPCPIAHLILPSSSACAHMPTQHPSHHRTAESPTAPNKQAHARQHHNTRTGAPAHSSTCRAHAPRDEQSFAPPPVCHLSMRPPHTKQQQQQQHDAPTFPRPAPAAAAEALPASMLPAPSRQTGQHESRLRQLAASQRLRAGPARGGGLATRAPPGASPRPRPHMPPRGAAAAAAAAFPPATA